MPDALNTLLQWIDPSWVMSQFQDGDGLPFVIWTVVSVTIGFAVGYLVGKKRAGWVPKRTIAKGFSPEIKKAVAEALDSEGSVVLGGRYEAVVGFARAKDGVFTFPFPLDELGDADTYQLTPEWRSYLSRHRKYLE